MANSKVMFFSCGSLDSSRYWPQRSQRSILFGAINFPWAFWAKKRHKNFIPKIVCIMLENREALICKFLRDRLFMFFQWGDMYYPRGITFCEVHCFQIMLSPAHMNLKRLWMGIDFFHRRVRRRGKEAGRKRIKAKVSKDLFLCFCLQFYLQDEPQIQWNHSNSLPDTYKTLNFLEFKQEILRYEAFPQ